jgi:tetratricopeptide (TPR) repeat protein
VYEKLGKLDDAITDFTAVLTLDPNHIKASYARGACRNLKGDFASAIGALAPEIAAAPAAAAASGAQLAGSIQWLQNMRTQQLQVYQQLCLQLLQGSNTHLLVAAVAAAGN